MISIFTIKQNINQAPICTSTVIPFPLIVSEYYDKLLF